MYYLISHLAWIFPNNFYFWSQSKIPNQLELLKLSVKQEKPGMLPFSVNDIYQCYLQVKIYLLLLFMV